jgi:hypothetical protein
VKYKGIVIGQEWIGLIQKTRIKSRSPRKERDRHDQSRVRDRGRRESGRVRTIHRVVASNRFHHIIAEELYLEGDS